MPYEGEFAEYGPLRRVVNDDKINSLLGKCKIKKIGEAQSELPRIAFADIEPSQFHPTHIIALDGSNISVPVRHGYPGAEVGYVTVASVILNIELLDKLEQTRPINPTEFRKTENTESIDSVLPGCNVVLDGEWSAKNSFRKIIFDLLKEKRLFAEGESLLDTYEALLEYKEDGEEQKCPYAGMYENSCVSSNPVYKKQKGNYSCHCVANQPLYSTDALRLHERFRSDSSNAAIYTEVMQVLERLWLVHILRNFEAQGYLRLLRNVAFIVDGPLAVFGQAAWLSQAIKKELQRLNNIAKVETDGQDMLIIGIEKTGTFVTHLEQLVDTKRNDFGNTGDLPFGKIAEAHNNNSVIPPQTACLLTDAYIKQNIIYSESSRPYGHQTYFGRKIFYRTKSGAQIVATLPMLNNDHENVEQATPKQYPRLADAMSLFDQLVSSRYPNSLSPISTAHSEAAIPLNLGKRVLEKLAHELMKS